MGQKLAEVGSVLDSWGRERFGDIPKKVADKKKKLQDLQSKVQNEQVVNEMREVEKDLDLLLEQEEILWAQRSRALWLKHGDQNTRFFHQKASQRRKRNTIDEIADDRGTRWIDDPNISRVLTEYFVELFTTSSPSEIEEATGLVAGRVSPAMANYLLAPFTREDVEEALFQMYPNKAPGVDGLPALFFQKFWHIVGDDVAHFCLQVLSGHVSPGNINQTLIVLIPKIKKPMHANQFRPISLCNVLFKLITKTIANRLKLILPDVINGPQSAFVPGRLITDNALIAYECFHFMKKKCSGRNGHMALKLDMSKAYDRVEWPFLQSVMTHMGFPLSWVRLIMSCVTTIRFQREIARSTLSGIKIARNAPVISHLLFADDSVIFAKATLEEANSVQQVLASYEKVSGQVINLDKSMLSCSRNVPSSRFDQLKRLLNVKAVESYDKYLGLPTIIGKSKTQIFNFVKERVWKKLKGWKESSLSRMGREVMVKAVAQAIPSYVMSCFMLPDGLCADIERMISKDFKAFNIALVGKNWWRLQRQPDTLLGILFKSVYFPQSSICAAKKGSRPSYAWTSIFRTKWVFEEGARWKVGDGKNIDIWHDKWLPDDSPLICREDLAQSANLTMVSQLLLPGTQVWNRDLVEMIFWPPIAKLILQIPLALTAKNDELYWPHTVDGLYTTKSGYGFIRKRKIYRAASSFSAHIAPVKFWKSLWHVQALPRCKEVAWRAVRGILPVRKLLQIRGVDVDASCPFCHDTPETIDHVLLQCPVSGRWWFAMVGGLRVQPTSMVLNFLQQIFELHDSNLEALCVSVLWVIWEARNRCVFQGVQPQVDDLMARLQMMVAPPRAAAPVRERFLPAAWIRPQHDIIKLNFDGSWKEDQAAGFGCVGRNAHGLVMAAATTFPIDAPSPLIVEALAFRWSLSLAADLFFMEIVLETDCLKLFDAWNKPLHGASYFVSILRDCKDLVSRFHSFSFSFVRRSGNSVADHLAKNSSKYPNCVWIEEVPPDCARLVVSDLFDVAVGLVAPSLDAIVPDVPFASLPRSRGRPKKVKRNRKPRHVSSVTCVDSVADDGGGISSSAIMPSVRPALLDSGSAPGGRYWTRAKKTWMIGKLVGCTWWGRGGYPQLGIRNEGVVAAHSDDIALGVVFGSSLGLWFCFRWFFYFVQGGSFVYIF
ncbi:uncharacterized protein LOC130718990 [Lotus japonicus]|uniref:uncharacterized protein LOC130718990 n=1 Tax=Lotus japonicus TaxID=34305 RepID=UPI00258D92AA|nr:uncharacterized protein LOC130718990 [Lotus japonicus]